MIAFALPRRFGSFARTAFCKLDFRKLVFCKLAILDVAACLTDRQVPPGNRLERINDQFRLCFVWTDAGPEDVEIVDVH